MGAGAIGSGVGGFLAMAGHEVTFIGREKHMSAIKKHGLKITGIWGEHLVNNINAKTNVDDVGVQDIILLTTKATDTEEAAKQFKHLVGDKTIVVSLQNGLDTEEILQEICGKDKVVGGMIIHGFEILKPGHVNATVFGGNIKLGEVDHKMSERVKKLAKLFNDAKLSADAVDNIEQFLWGKLLYNSCLNPLGAILGVNYGKLGEKYNWEIIQDIIKEVFLVTKKEGIELFWKNPKAYENHLKNKLLPMTASHISSMTYDLERGRRTEIDFLNGKVVELGLKHKIATPVNSMLCNMIKFKEKQNNLN